MSDDRPDLTAEDPARGLIRLEWACEPGADELLPYRRLAAAIVRQAARDALHPHMYASPGDDPGSIQVEASAWLADPAGAGRWLAWLGIDWPAWRCRASVPGVLARVAALSV